MWCDYWLHKTHKTKTNQEQESPNDRAARSTANATWIIAGFTAVLVSIAWYQYQEVENSTDLMSRMNRIYRQQAAQLSRQAGETHDLAIAAGKQADRTKDLADQMKDQANRTKTIADQAIIQAGAAKQLAQTSVDTLHNTQKAFHDEQRAWIGIETATPVSFEKGATVEYGPTFSLSVAFTLRNYGHSAAQHVRIFPKLEVIDASNTHTGICNDSTGGKVYVGDVIFPEQKRDYSWGISIPLADMESAVKRQNPAMGRNLILSLRGCVEYIDDPNEVNPHHTPFSYFVMRVGSERYFTPDLQSVPGGDITLDPASIYPGPTD